MSVHGRRVDGSPSREQGACSGQACGGNDGSVGLEHDEYVFIVYYRHYIFIGGLMFYICLFLKTVIKRIGLDNRKI